MTRRRFAAFAIAAAMIGLLAPAAALLAVDLYLHHKYMDLVALNIWGYRGPAVGSKQPDEWRLAVVGGSTAFGYGVRWDQAFPAYLEDFVNASGQTGGRTVTALNLGYNGDGAHANRLALVDYEYLNYDAVLFYSGYNDIDNANPEVFRHASAIYRLTGYYPLLPIILREKAMSIRAGGDLEGAYRGEKTVFRPDITERATAGALEAALRISESLERQLGRRLPDSNTLDASTEGDSCGSNASYCAEMYASIKPLLDQGKQVLMTTQPYISESHREQQRRLREFLRLRFGDHPRLRFADLGDAVSLKDPVLCYDGMHLTPQGNRRIATALVPHVRSLLNGAG